MDNKIPFYKQKTTWTGVAAMITLIGSYCTGAIPLESLIRDGFLTLMAVFLRQGIEKTK